MPGNLYTCDTKRRHHSSTHICVSVRDTRNIGVVSAETLVCMLSLPGAVTSDRRSCLYQLIEKSEK